MIKFACSYCSKKIQVADAVASKKGRCPQYLKVPIQCAVSVRFNKTGTIHRHAFGKYLHVIDKQGLLNVFSQFHVGVNKQRGKVIL